MAFVGVECRRLLYFVYFAIISFLMVLVFGRGILFLFAVRVGLVFWSFLGG